MWSILKRSFESEQFLLEEEQFSKK